MSSRKSFMQEYGLHPLVGFGMFAVDWMLFAGEVGTLGASWPVSIPVAIVLTIACTLIQRYAFKDDWGTAAGKSLIIGLLTAIPTPIPSIVPLSGGLLGTVRVLLPGK
jgi:hypothetical protein